MGATKEYINSYDIEEILCEMNGEEFLQDEIQSQIDGELFKINKTNLVEAYMNRYKKLKKVDCDDYEDYVSRLKDSRDIFLRGVLEILLDKFDISADVSIISSKDIKTIYNFLIINYRDNLVEYFVSAILRHEKDIVKALKAMKLNKNIGASDAFNSFSKPDLGLIINNISVVVENIVPNLDLSMQFMDYVLLDESVTNDKITKLIDTETIIINDTTIDNILEPFVDQEDGYSNIFYDIVTILINSMPKSNMDLVDTEYI